MLQSSKYTFCKELKDYDKGWEKILDENNKVHEVDDAHQFSYSTSNPHWRVGVWKKIGLKKRYKSLVTFHHNGFP